MQTIPPGANSSLAPAYGRSRSVGRYCEIVARLDEVLRERPMAPLYSHDLARWIGTSPRTLQTALQAIYGVSLHRYVRLMRLWTAPCQLQSGCRSVKDAALGNGFAHMGDFSHLYKTTFGETPSETLARAKLQRGRAFETPPRAN